MGHGETIGHGPRFGEIAAGDGGDDTVFRILNGGHDQLGADLRGGQNSETQHLFLRNLFDVRHLSQPMAIAQSARRFRRRFTRMRLERGQGER